MKRWSPCWPQRWLATLPCGRPSSGPLSIPQSSRRASVSAYVPQSHHSPGIVARGPRSRRRAAFPRPLLGLGADRGRSSRPRRCSLQQLSGPDPRPTDARPACLPTRSDLAPLRRDCSSLMHIECRGGQVGSQQGPYSDDRVLIFASDKKDARQWQAAGPVRQALLPWRELGADVHCRFDSVGCAMVWRRGPADLDFACRGNSLLRGPRARARPRCSRCSIWRSDRRGAAPPVRENCRITRDVLPIFAAPRRGVPGLS